MRRAVLTVAGVLLLSGPTVLAFFSGGYYVEPRLIAAIAAWALVVALALTGEAALPRTPAGWLALGGLVLLTAWSAVSVAWAPLREPAIEAVERLVLYTGALLLAIGVLRTRAALRAVEPALAAGATVVIGYGLAGRLLPGLVHLDRSRSAGGRLEQPITYWNAEGALAAVGLVLCARLAADRTRPPAVRVAAAAATAPLGAGVYLSYSRGALAGAVLGLAILVAAAPTYGQLRASVLALVAGAAAAAVAAALPGVAALEGSEPERDGAIALVAFALLAAGAGVLAARSRVGPDRTLPHSGRLAPAAGIVVAAVAVGLVAAGLSERPTAAELAAGATAGRLTTVSSNRYEYWRIGLAAFERRPLGGLGAAGFRVEWLRERSDPRGGKGHALPRGRGRRRARPAGPGRARDDALRGGAGGAARGARARPGGRRARRSAADLVPPRVDRLGLAAARGVAARDRARGRAGRARRARLSARALRGSSRRCAASERPAALGESSIRTRHAVTLSGSRRTTSSSSATDCCRSPARLTDECPAQVRPRPRVEEVRPAQVRLRPGEHGGIGLRPQRGRPTRLQADVALHHPEPGQGQHRGHERRPHARPRRQSASAIRGASRLNTHTARRTSRRRSRAPATGPPSRLRAPRGRARSDRRSTCARARAASRAG